MRERKYVKFRVDMPEDTKFKIIDMKPERDVIHYIWNRIVLLAGKVNLEGDLYISKNIPYTIETLAIEFNRDIAQIKLALEVFIELEMIELTEDKIYRVTNFAKHQNIKVKEKEISKNEEADAKNIDVPVNKNLKVEIGDDKDTNPNHRTIGNAVQNAGDANGGNAEVNNKDIIIVDDSIEEKKSRDNLQKDAPIILETKKGRKGNGNKMVNMKELEVKDEKITDNSICCFTNGVRPLGEGESTVLEWSFG